MILHHHKLTILNVIKICGDFKHRMFVIYIFLKFQNIINIAIRISMSLSLITLIILYESNDSNIH